MLKIFTVLLFFILSIFVCASDKNNGEATHLTTHSKFNTYNIKAQKLCEQGETKKALLVYKTGLNEAFKDKKVDLLSYYFNEIGNLEADFGNNTQAFKHYQNALKFNTKNNPVLNAKIFKNIGALYLSWKKFNVALKYYQTAYNLGLKAKDGKLIADCLNNMGTVYEQQKAYSKAEHVYYKALSYYKKLDINTNICITHNNLAILNKVTGKFSQAAKHYKFAVHYASKTKNDWLLAAIGNNLGNLYCEMGELKRSEVYLINALTLAKKINAKELVHDALENLSTLASKNNNYKLAFNYYKLSAQAKSEFINAENTKEMLQLQTKYDVLSKEKKISLLNKENIIQKLTINKRNYLATFLGVFFLLSVAFSVLFFNRNKIKQQNILQQTIIKQQDIATKAIIEAEDNERSRIASDLHDGVGQLFSTVKMNLSGMQHDLVFKEKATQLNFEKTILLVDESCKEIRSISHQMMPNVLLKMGLVSALRDFINKVDERRLKINLDVTGITKRLATNTETVLYRVIQEAVNNVIKHAGASVLDIQILKDNDGLAIMIEDNGKGFDSSQIANFKGIGFKNLHTRIKLLNGTIEIDSSLGKGTAISVWLPSDTEISG
ncbi:MAG: hypothetical protein EAZ51_03375 [Sphingobacteriales bacterium]|nr:MAG: hypothetical protein EAZ64_04785 [Sphingobacteriales bacterium]TAF81874.1 MAG: hypothetical protein EAZ51_03375 [Sphingobacteriales bacterium]